MVVGGMHGWGSMRGCGGACVVVGGMCGCRGGVCGVCGCGGHVWL